VSERRPADREPEIVTERGEPRQRDDWWGDWDGRRWRDGIRAGRSGRSTFPWPGVFLVLLGAGLLVRQLDGRMSLTAVVLLALGFSFVAYWVVNRSTWPLAPALLLLSLAAGRLLGDLGVVQGDGPTALLLGGALLVIWAAGRRRGRGPGWALWLGGILLLIGVAQASAQMPGVPDMSGLWPLVIVGVGVVLIATSTRWRDRS
jgi:hypothetical protein